VFSALFAIDAVVDGGDKGAPGLLGGEIGVVAGDTGMDQDGSHCSEQCCTAASSPTPARCSTKWPQEIQI